MRNINKLPKFMPGQIVDLSYRSNNGLPNRILIHTVFTSRQHTGWMYRALSEITNETLILTEDAILQCMIHKDAQVYKNICIIKLYNDGWRFAGNYEKIRAQDNASRLALNDRIKNVAIRPALDVNGFPMDNKFGVWVRYYNQIDDVTVNNDDDMVIVK